MKLITIAVPLFNEEQSFGQLYQRLCDSVDELGEDIEFVLVDDGSTDATPRILDGLAAKDPRVRVIHFSRNFGHQPACTAALAYSRGDAVVLMDGDLQDPPAVVPQLVAKWKEGSSVVLARRRTRPERGLRGMLIRAFHRLFPLLTGTAMPPDVGVFSLMDRRVVDELLRFEERNRYLPGLRWWLGFPTAEVWYNRADRAGGEPKQSLKRLALYALDAIFSFSYRPLRVATLLGLCVSTLSFLYALVLIVLRVLDINVVLGFTTQAASTFFLGGTQLVFIGILGEYLARTYDETKRRPLYIVERVVETGDDSRRTNTDRTSGSPPLR